MHAIKSVYLQRSKVYVLFAAKGKVEIQAQDDGVDAIARQGIKLFQRKGAWKLAVRKKLC